MKNLFFIFLGSYMDNRVKISNDNVSIKRDESKCINCGSCQSVCKYAQSVYGYYDNSLDEPICIKLWTV